MSKTSNDRVTGQGAGEHISTSLFHIRRGLFCTYREERRSRLERENNAVRGESFIPCRLPCAFLSFYLYFLFSLRFSLKGTFAGEREREITGTFTRGGEWSFQKYGYRKIFGNFSGLAVSIFARMSASQRLEFSQDS